MIEGLKLCFQKSANICTKIKWLLNLNRTRLKRLILARVDMDYIDMEIMWIRQRRAEKICRSGMGRQGRMGEKDGNGGGQEVQEGHRG